MTEPSETEAETTELPWRCFHCDEVFSTKQEAEDHFGLEEFEFPACVQVLTETEKAIVEDRREWRRRAKRAEEECETLGHRINAESWELRRFGPDCRTVTDAWYRFETEQGLRLSAEEKLAWLLRRARDFGVPWEPLPHDDRSPEEILGPGESWPGAEELPYGSHEKVLSNLLSLHQKLLLSDSDRSRYRQSAETDFEDSGAVLDAAILIEKQRARIRDLENGDGQE